MDFSVISLEHVSKYFDNPNKLVIDNFNLVVNRGEIITLLGPSGCGKTTLLRLIAGFERQEKGTIKINEIIVSSNDRWIPPEKRGIGMVFQDYALFPHLNVRENIVFALSKWDKNLKESRVEEVLKLVGLSEYESRFPFELSGGQQQRVALARALAPKPNLILLDEPFSNLDTEMRVMMRKEIREIIKKTKTTAIFVSHDQKDAMSISDRIVVMNKGKTEQIDHPINVYKKPATKFVATFTGVKNFIEGIVSNDGKLIHTNIGSFSCNYDINNPTRKVLVSIRSEGIIFDEDSLIRGIIKYIQFLGEYIEYLVEIIDEKGNPITLTVHSLTDIDMNIGKEIGIKFLKSSYSYFPKELGIA